jgi:hypothetical protein
MRLVIPILLVVVCAAPALAQQAATSPLDPVYQCASITNDQERLACFDQAVARLRSSASEGRIIAVDREQAVAAQRESFGFDLPLIARLFGTGDNELEQVQAQVVEVTQRNNGLYTFVLSNGQTWAQIEPQRNYNVRVDDAVEVRRAMFGSFLLSSERGGAAHRVRRVS